MPSDREPILGDRGDRILPIVDRNTPLLDRIRERRKKMNSLGMLVGERVAEVTLMEDDDERNRIANKARDDFRTGLANSLGVPEDTIRDDIVDQFSLLFFEIDEHDMVDLDVSENDEHDEGSESDEEDDSIFDSNSS